jgi:predicted glycoside hydrolase/deacetylase ChbG (UPF0249 family)
MKTLVINADDFGYCPKRNQGIIDCYLKNAITNATLLVNALYVEHAVDLALKHGLPLGLHFNITEGKPVSSIERINSIIDSKNGLFLGKFGLREALLNNKTNQEHILIELNAQIDRFKQLTGKNPTHVDGHHHIHVHSQVVKVFASVLSQQGINATRLPKEKIEFFSDFTDEQFEFYKSVINDSEVAIDVFNSCEIRYTEGFLGMSIMGNRMNEARIRESLEKLFKTSESVEIMCHPGYRSEPFIGGCDSSLGPDEFSQSKDREHELNVLCSESLHKFYASLRISQF